MPNRRSDSAPTLSIYPHQVHIGDRFTDADTDGAAEWEVMSRPVTFKQGHEVSARVQRPGNPATARAKSWAGHAKIEVRRETLSRAAAVIAEAADEAVRNREIRLTARRDSAARGREAGPHAAAGLRRARVGEDAGEGAARDVDVVG